MLTKIKDQSNTLFFITFNWCMVYRLICEYIYIYIYTHIKIKQFLELPTLKLDLWIKLFFIRIIWRNFYVINNAFGYLFFLWQYTSIFLKTLADNTFYHFQEQNRLILLINQYSDSLLKVFHSHKNLYFLYFHRI